MILRVWSALSIDERKDEFYAFVMKGSAVDMENCGAITVACDRSSQGAGVAVLSAWSCWSDINAYNGKEPRKYVGDDHFVLEETIRIQHFEMPSNWRGNLVL